MKVSTETARGCLGWLKMADNHPGRAAYQVGVQLTALGSYTCAELSRQQRVLDWLARKADRPEVQADIIQKMRAIADGTGSAT